MTLEIDKSLEVFNISNGMVMMKVHILLRGLFVCSCKELDLAINPKATSPSYPGYENHYSF